EEDTPGESAGKFTLGATRDGAPLQAEPEFGASPEQAGSRLDADTTEPVAAELHISKAGWEGGTGECVQHAAGDAVADQFDGGNLTQVRRREQGGRASGAHGARVQAGPRARPVRRPRS